MGEVITPKAGEVWNVKFAPPGKQKKSNGTSGIAPAMVVSADKFNSIGAGTVIVVPIFPHNFGTTTRIKIDGAGLKLPGDAYAACDQIRSVGVARFVESLGMVSHDSRIDVERTLAYILDIPLHNRLTAGWGGAGGWT